MGMRVVGINRSGPPAGDHPWAADVEWVRADLLAADAETEVPKRLPPAGDAAVACASSIGAFAPSNEVMYRFNGTANVAAARIGKAAGAERFSFVSVHQYRLPGVVLRGYFEGKRDAEQEIQALYDDHTILQPGMIYGNRQISASTSLPLGAIGRPLELVANIPGVPSLAALPLLDLALVSPVSVEKVAHVAAAGSVKGIATVADIRAAEAA